MTTRVTDEVLVEAQALRAQTTLRVESARDGRIRIVLRESTDQR